MSRDAVRLIELSEPMAEFPVYHVAVKFMGATPLFKIDRVVPNALWG